MPSLRSARWVEQLTDRLGRLARGLLSPPRVRPPQRPLLKTAVRGGVLSLSRGELALGAGFFGSRLIWRVELRDLRGLHVEPPVAPGRGCRVAVIVRAGEPLRLEGVSPLAAQRLARLIAALGGAADAE